MLKILINEFKGMKCGGSFSFTGVLKMCLRRERRVINVLQYFIAWSAGLPLKKRSAGCWQPCFPLNEDAFVLCKRRA